MKSKWIVVGLLAVGLFSVQSGCSKPLTEKEEAEVRDLNIEVDVGDSASGSGSTGSGK